MISHVVVDARDSLCFRCLHCGGRHLPLLLPMPCEVYASACRGFALMHKHCAKPAEPSKQVELFDALVKSEQEKNPNGFGRPGHSTYVAGVDAHGRVDPVTFGIIGVGAEHDKPGTYAEFETGDYAKFARMYPAARTKMDLYHALTRDGVLTLEQKQKLTPADVDRWHPSEAAFQDIAHWARVSRARADAMASAQRGEPGEGGITIPLLPPMPLKLEQALGLVPKRAKAKKKSVRKPARKARARR